MKLTTLIYTAAAPLFSTSLAAPALGAPEVLANIIERTPQLCECAGYGCYDSSVSPSAARLRNGQGSQLLATDQPMMYLLGDVDCQRAKLLLSIMTPVEIWLFW